MTTETDRPPAPTVGSWVWNPDHGGQWMPDETPEKMTTEKFWRAATALALVLAIVALLTPCHYRAEPASTGGPTADATGSGGIDGSGSVG